jgi:hypothetical protein
MYLCDWVNELSHMQGNKPFQVCVIGTALIALCCFTAILDLGLGAVGLAAASAWLDGVLLGGSLSEHLCGVPAT